MVAENTISDGGGADKDGAEVAGRSPPSRHSL